uniref:Uncharacterized protein n=1 Tax=Parastrongyloides trichosuri TaxID=131310 RepID=A0A0N4ZLU7_PARTI
MGIEGDTEILIKNLTTNLLRFKKKKEKKRDLSMEKKIVERNRKLMEKCKGENNILLKNRSKKDEEMKNMIDNICKYGTKEEKINEDIKIMINNICKYGTKEPKIEEILIRPVVKAQPRKVSFDVYKDIAVDNNPIIPNPSDNCIEKEEIKVPESKFKYTVINQTSSTSMTSPTVSTSITSWSQLTTGYILLFFYFYLILEIRSTLSPIEYYT